MTRRPATALFALAAPFSLYLALSRHSTIHHDIFHQLALFREAVALGRLPTAELYAYTARLPVTMQHEWAAGAIALLFLSAFGAPALLALKSLLMLPVVWSLSRFAALRPALYPAAACLAAIAALMVSYSNHPVCAQSYSVAIFALLAWMLHLDRLGSRSWMLLFFPLFVLWVNVHAGFVVGLATMAAYAFEQSLRRRPWLHLFLFLAVCLASVSINPYGLAFYANLVHGLTVPRPIIKEWRPFWPILSFSFQGVVFLSSLALAGWAARTVGPRRFQGGIPLLFLAAATLKAEKVIPFYGVVWFAAMLNAARFLKPARAAARLVRREPGTFFVASSSMVVVCLAVFLSARPWSPLVLGTAADQVQHLVYPVGPVDYLRTQSFRGNLMTPFEQGAYVSWKLYPAVKVSCDSRYEVAYDTRWVERVSQMYLHAQDWQNTIARYPTDLVLVRRTSPLDKQLATASAWHRVYLDDTWRLYARANLTLPTQDRSGQSIEGALP